MQFQQLNLFLLARGLLAARFVQLLEVRAVEESTRVCPMEEVVLNFGTGGGGVTVQAVAARSCGESVGLVDAAEGELLLRWG